MIMINIFLSYEKSNLEKLIHANKIYFYPYLMLTNPKNQNILNVPE